MKDSNNINQKFFTKKKIITFSIALIIFGLIVYFTSKFLFDINFNTIGTLISNSHKNNHLFFLWFFLLVLFPIYNCLQKVIPYWYKLKKKKIFVEWYNWLLFCFITFFIGGITPFAIGAEPYIIYWLRKRGLSLKESTSIVASFTVINPFIQVLVTWPSFFVICSNYATYSDNNEWISCFWSVFVGLCFDLIGTCFWLLMSVSKNAHFWLNLLINWFKKILKLKYKTKDEIRYEYKENAVFKKLFINELKDIKFVIFMVLGSLLWNVLYYCEIIFAFNFMDPGFRFNAGDLFNYVNVATTANNFVPIPGAEGSLQAVLIVFIQNSSNNIISNKEELTSITNNSVFIWRTFTFYVTTLLGLLCMICLILKEFYKHIIRKTRIKNKYGTNTFTIIVKTNSTKNLMITLESIKNLYYEGNLIDILVAYDKNKKIKLSKKISNLNLKLLPVLNLKTDKVIRTAYKKNFITNDYIMVINNGDILTYESLFSMNNVLRNYDIYANQYKNYIGEKLKRKSSPYCFIFFKRFDKLERMCSPKFNLCSFVFSKNLVEKWCTTNTQSFNSDLSFYLSLVNYAKNLRFRRKLVSYKCIENIYLEKSILTKELKQISKINPSVMCYMLLTKKIRDNLDANFRIHLDSNIKFLWLPWYVRVIKQMQFKILYKNRFIC